MMKASLALTMAVSVTGCATETKEPGRSDARVSEIERILSSNGTTTIERIELGYDGSNLSQVNAFKNGMPNGTARLTYFNDQIHRIDFADKDGDRAFTTFEWYGDLLWKRHEEVMGVLTVDRTVWYDEATWRVKEVKFARNSPGTETHVWMTAYAYDSEGRVQKMSDIDDAATQTTQTSELSYGTDGLVKRMSTFTGSQHDETWDFRYLQDGRLDEVYDTHGRNISVTYGADNLVSELRVLDGSTTETIRYTYEPETVNGLTFAPELPVAGQFDLAGKSYGDLALMHLSPPIVDDVPHVTTGDVCVVDDQTSCSACLNNNCCDTCTTSSCYSYVSCAASCNGSSSCLSSCAQSYPGNASFGQCATSYCPSSCQL
jgi:hypothetical protein